MGTNFYLHEKPDCSECHRPFRALHVGKSSAGWTFCLHVIPDIGINDLPDWEKRWSQPGVIIRDEYGEAVAPEEMRRRITERASGLNRQSAHSRDATPGAGTWDLCPYEFS